MYLSGPERGGLDQGPVDVLRTRGQGQADQQPAELVMARIDRLPLHQSSATRPCCPTRCSPARADRYWWMSSPLLAGPLVVIRRDGVVHEPGEDVTDAALLGLVTPTP